MRLRLILILLITSFSVMGQGFLTGIVFKNTTVASSVFTLSEAENVSAGVYDGNVLIRTLFNNVRYGVGTYSLGWDGTDDIGVYVRQTGVTYNIHILKSNVNYTWEGAFIGNTSDSMTGTTKHRALYDCMTGIAFTSAYGYFCTGYSEGVAAAAKFDVSKPQQTINFTANYHGKIVDLNTTYVATDGTNVYWAGLDSYAPSKRGQYNSMVYATRTSDDARINFASGTDYAMSLGSIELSAISYRSASDTLSYISGMAVQKTHNFLFVSRKGINQVQVLNKNTGAVVATLTLTNPRSLCVDANDNVWVCTGTNTVTKYAVNSTTGLLSAPLVLSGLIDPLAITVSPDNTTVIIADGGNAQQVKAYNNTTGAASWTLGTSGGYFTDATVNNSKFYFSDVQGYDHKYRPVFLAYQTDGSLWISDAGNSRVQHYDNSRTFINRIMSLSASYHVYVDPNNPTRVWSDAMEFSIDYSQPLKTSWTLVKNWGPNITPDYSNSDLQYPVTLTNGRTYALIRKVIGSSTREVVEFLPTGQLRFTGIISHGARVISPDGAIQVYNRAAIGDKASASRFPLTGFDGSNNPLWGTEQILVTTPIVSLIDPVGFVVNGNCITSTNKVIVWNINLKLDDSYYTGYHLGAIQIGDSSWVWKTERATYPAYRGDYPPAGFFDIGNNVKQYGGGTVSILGRNVITSYHGEFWKNGQTNEYNHYWDNGLAVGQFGTTRQAVNAAPAAAAMMAGNVLTPMVVADPNDPNAAYLYHGDEAYHGGLHRWHITGLNTISEVIITIL